MAHKKKTGRHSSSKGLIGVNKKLSNAIRRERNVLQIHNAKMEAFRAGKNVVFTIENPNPNETNKKLIKVNARDLLGDWRSYRGFATK